MTSLECTVCKEADLSEVISGVLECGHVYCHDCIYRLWDTETAAATQRTEARAHQARTQLQTRAQMQARAAADAADNGRNVRCPCCQQCSSVDSVRRVFLSSSQAPSVASPGSITRTSSSSSAYEEKVEDLNAQLATAIEHLDAAHARAAETARAHDLNIQQMQAQLMAHAEQVHQSQLQDLQSTNMRLQSDLRNAQAQLRRATHEESQLRAQYDRAVEDLNQAREKSRMKKARASDAARSAGLDRLEQQLRANGTLNMPFKSETRMAEPARQTRSSATVVAPAPSSTHDGGRDVKKERGPIFTRHVIDHTPPSVKSEVSSTTSKRQTENTGVSSGTRSRRAEVAPTSLSDLRGQRNVKIEKKPQIAAGNPASVLQEVAPKRQTRATTSTKAAPEVISRQTDRTPTPEPDVESSEDEDENDYRNPAEQQNRRQEALARGMFWPLGEHIIVPVCTSKFDHKFSGLGSNGHYLKYHCKACDWRCEERKPEGYIPLSKRQKAR